jgi:hypothetical protein
VKLSLASVSVALAAAVMIAACAGSDDDNKNAAPNDADGGNTQVPPPPPDDAGTDSPDDDDDDDASPDAAIAPRECSKDGFCPTALPPKTSLRGVWSDGSDVTWAVSDEGAILRYANKAWTIHSTRKDEQLITIWGSGPTDIWIGSSSGLLHGEGASSSQISFTPAENLPGDRTPITSIWGTSATDVWAIGGANDFPLAGRLLHFAGKKAKGPLPGPTSDWTLENPNRDPVWWRKVFGSKTGGVFIAGIRDDRATFQREVIVMRRRLPQGTDFTEMELPKDPELPDYPQAASLEQVYDAAGSVDGKTMWLIGKTHSARPTYLRATSTDNEQTFTWSFHKNGVFGEPTSNAVAALSLNEAWILGDYGRLQHFNGTKWVQSRITVTKLPVTTPFFAAGGHESDLWFVGDDIALHRDPSKASN